MTFREATVADISQLHRVRMSVRENMLSNPALVTEADYISYLTVRGKGWVCESDEKIVGFAVADLHENNIWALFVEPGSEGRGIGQKLHFIMLDWYFSMKAEPVWLSTAAGTRAERFYREAGWTASGLYGKDELKFEMTKDNWLMPR